MTGNLVCTAALAVVALVVICFTLALLPFFLKWFFRLLNYLLYAITNDYLVLEFLLWHVDFSGLSDWLDGAADWIGDHGGDFSSWDFGGDWGDFGGGDGGGGDGGGGD